MNKRSRNPFAAVIGAAIALSGTAAQAAAFQVTELGAGYQVAAADTTAPAAQPAAKGEHEGKCGEGKCGADKAATAKKHAEGKCGEGKCGADKAAADKKPAEGKCGEGKCGEKK